MKNGNGKATTTTRTPSKRRNTQLGFALVVCLSCLMVGVGVVWGTGATLIAFGAIASSIVLLAILGGER